MNTGPIETALISVSTQIAVIGSLVITMVVAFVVFRLVLGLIRSAGPIAVISYAAKRRNRS